MPTKLQKSQWIQRQLGMSGGYDAVIYRRIFRFIRQFIRKMDREKPKADRTVEDMDKRAILKEAARSAEVLGYLANNDIEGATVALCRVAAHRDYHNADQAYDDMMTKWLSYERTSS